MASSSSTPTSGQFSARSGFASMSSAKPVKKLVVKNLKDKPQLAADFGDVTWQQLASAVRAIQNAQPINSSLESLYQACSNMCLNNMSKMLYERLEAECRAHLDTVLHRVRSSPDDPAVFLSVVGRCWQDHLTQMMMIRQIFLYLDRAFVIQTSGILPIYDMGLHQFREHVIMKDDIRRKLVSSLLHMIEADRNGEQVDRALLRVVVNLFVDLSIYASHFEKPFLEHTKIYYEADAQKNMAALEGPQYLLHCEARLKEEADRIGWYLDVATRKPLLETVEQRLVKAHATAILERCFETLVDDDRIEDLARLFSLLSRVDSLEPLKAFFSVYIRKKGAELVTDPERDRVMVEDLLRFKDRLDHICNNAFQRHPLFLNTLKESFEHFINVRQNKPAELIAKFIDSKLRAGNKEATEEELESLLDRVLILFRFIQGKDVFEAFYKKDLAKRLLLARSASVDAEKSMLAKLKQECGSQFTTKLEGMFKDIDVSHDIMLSFKQSRACMEKLGSFELNVSVLTAGNWPTYPPMEVHLPNEMNEYVDVFRTFYLSKHSGVRLMWQHSLGTCILRANFPLGRKELSVSLFQALVLLLFNDKDTRTYQEIANMTGIEHKELKRTLQSLACGKVRVLAKIPKGRDVDDTDSFEYESKFRNSLTRIKINQIQLKETQEEQEDTTERVFLDRQYQVDAAIVRIMKTRKTLHHNLLLSELFEQLKFPVKAADLKKRIESLIDREYLKRDDDNASLYHYLA